MKATGTCQFTYDYGDMWEQYYTSVENKKEVQFKIAPLVIFCNSVIYFTSSKTTLTDYQCVSTGCCTHVAKTEITIDNQHVTNKINKSLEFVYYWPSLEIPFFDSFNHAPYCVILQSRVESLCYQFVTFVVNVHRVVVHITK